MRPFAAILALTAASFSTVASAADQGHMWTVTCTRAGNTIYMATVPDANIATRSLEIQNAFKDATCISIAEAVAPPAIDNGSGVVSIPVPGSHPLLSTGTPSLDNALRALRGERILVSPRPAPSGPSTPAVQYAAPAPEPTVADFVPTGADWVRLAVYRNSATSDLYAVWKNAVMAAPLLLGSMTPDIEEKGNLSALIAGPVSPSERIETCIVATGLGFDCQFGRVEKIGDDSLSMSDFLAFAGAEPSRSCPRLTSIQIASMEAAGDDVVTSGRRCWNSRFSQIENSRLGDAPPLSAIPSPARTPLRGSTAKAAVSTPRASAVAEHPTTLLAPAAVVATPTRATHPAEKARRHRHRHEHRGSQGPPTPPIPER